jgi:hypothetical protein
MTQVPDADPRRDQAEQIKRLTERVQELESELETLRAAQSQQSGTSPLATLSRRGALVGILGALGLTGTAAAGTDQEATLGSRQENRLIDISAEDIDLDKLRFNDLTEDPPSSALDVGDIFYRRDLDEFRVQTNNNGLQAIQLGQASPASGVPSSVVHQYTGDNFTTSTWTDSIGNADMSINGVSASTLNGDRAPLSDGVDDVGLADGPQTLPENEKFGVAMVVAGTDKTDNTRFFGVRNPNSAFQLTDADFRDSSNGEPFLILQDSNDDRLTFESTVNIMDSTSHLLVVNKLANSGAGAVKMFIDDMSADTATIEIDQGFSHTDYSVSRDVAFFSRNNVGTIDSFKAFDLPFIEFNEQPYSQQDRLDLKQRAPGL